MKIRTLLVDDEPPARDELAYLLASFPDLEVSEARNASEALSAIRETTPDLVFLDIQMPGRDGFYVLRESLCLPDPPLFVFVTAYNDYAVRAFEENAVDYLLKPVARERLQKSVERVRGLLRRSRESGPLQPELAALVRDAVAGPPSGALVRLTVETGGRIQLLDASEVTHCERQDKHILVHTRTESFPCHGTGTLDELEERLRGQAFFRANRGTLVNLERVREFAPWTGGKYSLVLDDDAGTEVTLSRSRVKDFKQCLGI
ncbi:LytR/AlgR family response regulator transcription factor [Paucidesulfovibrio longus]|uniref:LytR/AlgR family response regulator transcription factor n=1 Tax=Paucidesulfovibrio longus TaxID=889 RepID=UPI0003B6B2DF|nr:LytTR family DNA-binding domain-containing protein [Paucidesulfovibrio longus]